MTARDVAKLLLPPLVVQTLRRRRPDGLRFTGHPSSWAAALEESMGYSDVEILERVVVATREVVAGRAAYERDSVLFRDAAIPLQVVAGILRSAVQDSGRVVVIDVGGSLGSTYRHCRDFLGPVTSVRWEVVEQPAFVQVGQEEFTTAELRFHESIAAVPASAVPVTFLLSGVLQYLEEPADMLRSLSSRPSRHLIIDRTPISLHGDDRLCIQHAPRSVYNVTYPAWILSRDRLMGRLEPHWVLLSDEPGFDGRHETPDGLSFEFRSLIWERRS